METAKIRQAGYPIRHDYFNFVNRYRYLTTNILPAHKANPRESAEKICKAVFQKNEDYQLGNTKVFLKHIDNERLEDERTKILSKYIIVLQTNIRGFLCRQRYKKLKKAALVMQKHWRARGYRSRFLKMRYGFKRLQARIASRQSTFNFNRDRDTIRKFQPFIKGYLVRQKKPVGQIYNIVKLKNIEEQELKKAGNKNYKHVAEVNMQKRLAELNRSYTVKEKSKQDEAQPNELVDNLFDFLKDNEAPPSAAEIKESEEILVRIENKLFTMYH